MFSAITWCLFGQCIRSDMKASFVVNDKTNKNCCVSIQFENGYTIERFRKYSVKGSPRKGTGIRVLFNGKQLDEFEKGSVRDSQEALEHLIGINFDTFSKSVICDNSVRFLISNTKNRREMIEQLLGLDRFDDYLMEVRDQLKNKKLEMVDAEHSKSLLEMEITRSQDAIQHHHIKIIEIEEKIKEIKNKTDAINKNLENIQKDIQEKDKTLKELESNWQKHTEFKMWKANHDLYQSRKAQFQELSTKIQQNTQQIAQLLSEKKKYEEEVKRYNEVIKRVEKQREELSTLRDKKTTAENKVSNIDEQIARMKVIRNKSQCPTCLQPIQEHTTLSLKEEIEHLEQRKREFATQAESLHAEIQKTIKMIEENTKLLQHSPEMKLFHISREIDRLERENISNNTQIQRLNELISQDEKMMQNSKIPAQSTSELSITYLENSKKDMAALNEQLMHQRNQLYSTQADENVLYALLEQHQQNISTLEEKCKKLKENIQQLSENDSEHLMLCRALEFWETAFDKKPTKAQLDRGLTTMRSYLLEQSIKDMNNLLNEYSQFFGRKCLSLSFNPDLTIQEEDYGKRSSGQRKRNDLAILFSLFELVRQRSRFRAHFLMLDEVFDALDESGQEEVQQVLDILSQRIPKVFVITHSKLVNQYATNVIRMEMTDRGTRMVC